MVVLDKRYLSKLIQLSKEIQKGNIRYRTSEAILHVHNINECLKKLSELTVKSENCEIAERLLNSPTKQGITPLKVLVNTRPYIINNMREPVVKILKRK